MSAEVIRDRNQCLEHEEFLPNLSIRYPDPDAPLEVRQETDRILVMRKDTSFSITPVAERISAEYGLAYDDVTQVMSQAYDEFGTRYLNAVARSVPDEQIEIHLYEPEVIEERLNSLSSNSLTVSLDPLVPGDQNYQTSREHHVTLKRGQRHRNGSHPLDLQRQMIAAELDGRAHPDTPISLGVAALDDDLFSGGTAANAARLLLDSGVGLDRFIFGLQIGKGERLTEMGLEVESVVDYSDIAEELPVDLTDFRDFAIGYDGMGVLMPSGGLGRIACITPFFSPSEDTFIPQENEIAFSHEILLANLIHFQSMEDQLGVPILLRHMHPDVVMYMNEVNNINANTRMADLVEWIIRDHDRIWQRTQYHAQLQVEIASRMERMQAA